MNIDHMEINVDDMQPRYVNAVGVDGNKITLLLQDRSYVHLNETELQAIADIYKNLKKRVEECRNCGLNGWRPGMPGNQ